MNVTLKHRFRPGRRPRRAEKRDAASKGAQAVRAGRLPGRCSRRHSATVQQRAEPATALPREVQLDNPNVSIEETMVADAGRQSGSRRLAGSESAGQAYSDIMNMQVLRLAAWASGRLVEPAGPGPRAG